MPMVLVSDRYGVNPSVMQCFFCLRETGVVLLGRLPGDEKAPAQAVFDMTPCEECRKNMERGIILISYDPIQSSEVNNPYRTGGWCVVRDRVITQFAPKDVAESILEKRFAFVDDTSWNLLGLPLPR